MLTQETLKNKFKTLESVNCVYFWYYFVAKIYKILLFIIGNTILKGKLKREKSLYLVKDNLLTEKNNSLEYIYTYKTRYCI